MRDLKLRAWQYGKMDYRPEWPFIEGTHDMGIGNGFKDWEVSCNSVLMQYIGLEDKNGREIYEGDIMREFNNHVPEVPEYSYYEVKFGEMDDLRWGYYLDGYVAVSSKDVFEKFEVIGNIYENKELLK